MKNARKKKETVKSKRNQKCSSHKIQRTNFRSEHLFIPLQCWLDKDCGNYESFDISSCAPICRTAVRGWTVTSWPYEVVCKRTVRGWTVTRWPYEVVCKMAVRGWTVIKWVLYLCATGVSSHHFSFSHTLHSFMFTLCANPKMKGNALKYA